MPLETAIAYAAARVTGSAVAPCPAASAPRPFGRTHPATRACCTPTTYDEVANITTFTAPDWARTITASEINITGGADINRPRTMRTDEGDAMSSDKTATAREILRRNITAVNNRDMNAYLANQHPDVEFVLPGGATLRGREQVRASTQAFWDAFPDGRLEFGAQVLAEESAATEVVFSGTHTGPMQTPSGEFPATGKTIRTTSISMLTFADGMVISEHVYSDQLELLTQLGLAASP